MIRAGDESRAPIAVPAIAGGPPVRPDGFPPRRLFGRAEQAEVHALFERAIESGAAFRYGGPDQRAYEAELAAFHGGGHATLVSSGTAALYATLGALELAIPGEVIVPPVTDPGGVMPVPLLNLVPIFADARPGELNTGVRQVETALSRWTRAIIVAHVGGEPAEVDAIAELARRKGIPLIEDCSQAHGATWNGQLVGTFGDVAVLSTMSSKHHATGGQGGVILTRDSELHARARSCSDRGKTFRSGDDNGNTVAALNLNGSDLAAAIGRVQLRRLPEIVERRRDLACRLRSALAEVDAVRVPDSPPEARSSWWFMRLSVERGSLAMTRDELVRALQAEGIPVGGSLAMPFLQPWYRERRVFGGSSLPWTLDGYDDTARNTADLCPNAVAAADHTVVLYFHESWSQRDVDDVRTALHKLERYYRKGQP